MRFFINASNLKLGGGLQVANSICYSLNRFKQHHFTVVLSSSLAETAESIKVYPNVSVFRYDVKNNLKTLLFGRDYYLDHLVYNQKIDCVLTVFGPSRWEPKCKHICGFARAQLVIPESPYYTRMGFFESIRNKAVNKIIKNLFTRKTKFFYSENSWISKRVEEFFKGVKCATVTNYYNQVFDQPDRWKDIELPSFSGYTVLNIGANYSHKNLNIINEVARIFKEKYSDIKIRFVLTLRPEDFEVPKDLKDMFFLIGKVDIASCPSLYKQSNIMFQPSLLECFSATYPEAMRMRVPIVTTDLEFSRGLCGDAALYYSPLDAYDAVVKLLEIIRNPIVADNLVESGVERLKTCDSYNDRSRKLIELCENVVNAEQR